MRCAPLSQSQGQPPPRLPRAAEWSTVRPAVAMAETEDVVVMDATDWMVIPAENLVASFASAPAKVLAYATNAADARLMLEALEIGTDGVVLRTDDWEEVAALAAYMRGREAARIPLCKGRVTRVEPVGMGDRCGSPKP